MFLVTIVFLWIVGFLELWTSSFLHLAELETFSLNWWLIIDHSAFADLMESQINTTFNICFCSAKHLLIAYFQNKPWFLKTCKICWEISGVTCTVKWWWVVLSLGNMQENKQFVTQLIFLQVKASLHKCLKCRCVCPSDTFHIGNTERKMYLNCSSCRCSL